MPISEFIQRDLSQKVEGVVKVFDASSIASEVREYVLTDKSEDQFKRIFDTFTQVSETIRRGGKGRDVMGIWVSGFFGSGKSHFAKLLGYLLQNAELPDGSGQSAIDAFLKHLSGDPRGRDIRLRLAEIKANTQIVSIPFEIRSVQSLNNPNSVGEILLGEFYRYLGFSSNFIIARIEQQLQRAGLFDQFKQTFKDQFSAEWESREGRDDLSKARNRLVKVLPLVDPKNYKDEATAKQGLRDAFSMSKITAEGIAEELVNWVDEQNPPGGRSAHLVFVIDEMGTFIGDSNDKIGELNSLAEMIGNKGKGKVWIVCTSQQDLEKVVDRTNFQPALVGRLNARFELKPHLVSDGIDKVISERILKKHPSKEDELKALYKTHEGKLHQLADLKASRTLGTLNERSFIDCYPFLPHQIQLAQDVGEALSGFRISGGVRSMISVVMESMQKLANKDLGATASLDLFFDALKEDLLSQEYLGAAGVHSILEADKRVPVQTPIPATRVLKVLWLIQQVPYVPRIPEVLAKLLVTEITDEIAEIRQQVEETLSALQDAGYVARDEATGEWKYLNERERTIEQVIQEMIRPGGSKSISISSARRTSLEVLKNDVIAKKRMQNFAVLHGTSKTPFEFGVYLDGEAVDTGSEIEVRFLSPLASGRKQEVEGYRQANQQAGAKGRIVYWVSNVTDSLETRLKRYEALKKVTSDKRFTDDASSETQDALSEKRRERDDLAKALIKEMEQAFLNGTLYYGGQTIDVDRAPDLISPLQDALAQQIPNIYPRFRLADKAVDFNRALKGLLNPAQAKLHEVAPELDLFDSQGNLQKESALVGQVLEVLRDLEDEGFEATGTRLLDARDEKGFRGFDRAPFHWPDEVLRLILTACMRAGAIYLERQSTAGTKPVYDYREAADDFGKINTFKKATFRLAETTLTVDQIKACAKALIGFGAKGAAESGNALAAAVRKLGDNFLVDIKEAQTRSETGLPVPAVLQSADAKIREVVTQKDPTKVVLQFLQDLTDWQAIGQALTEFRQFLDNNRHLDFARYRDLLKLLQTHPLPEDHADAQTVAQCLADIEAISKDKAIVTRWFDYRSAADKLHEIYRGHYRERYDHLRSKAQEAHQTVLQGDAYANAPADQRNAPVDKVFGPTGVCHYGEIEAASLQSLLEHTRRHSLSSLEQALTALPVYQSQVEAALRQLKAPPPKPTEKRYTWRAGSSLAGHRFTSEAEVDEALAKVANDLKTRIRDGYTIEVES